MLTGYLCQKINGFVKKNESDVSANADKECQHCLLNMLTTLSFLLYLLSFKKMENMVLCTRGEI